MPKTIYHALLVPFGWDQRFELLEKIGAGAMGQVWRAREIGSCGRKPVAENVGDGDGPPDHRLAAAATVAAGASPWGSDRIVALKFLDPTRAGDEQTLARLEIEGETLTKLRVAGSHEHVVPIIDFKVSDSHACLIMEFIPGLSLKKWCETYRLELRDRVRLIAQVARASGWFHGLGIVHRDLKPANILVHAVTHQPVIVDFSIAKQDEGVTLTLTNEALGTAPYMAPEQFDQKRGPISPATDVFALGATLYELLTQVHPHPGDFTQIMQRLVDEVRPAPPSALNPAVPKDLESIILKALSHRPADRYADGTELADDLDRFLAGEPVMARPISTVAYLARRARRKPALTAALAACFMLGGIALWNMQRRAVQRERFILESKLTAAMQDARPWTATELEAGETTLNVLNAYDPQHASVMRLRLHEDIVHDMERRLSQNHLRDDDFAWLRDTASWLRPRLPDQASRIERLITERAGRWETQAELRPPFADLQGLFPKSKVQVVDGLLYPADAGVSGKLPTLTVSEAISIPIEISSTFIAGGGTFKGVAVEISQGNSRATAALYKASQVSKTILEICGEQQPHPDSYVLVLVHKNDFQRAIHIPDTHLLDTPFRLTLRLEQDQAEALINSQWRLHLDSSFGFGSIQGQNYCRLSWSQDVGLQHLILRTRQSDRASPLDQADALGAEGHWMEALNLYESLRGDPIFGAEASFKIGECLLRLKRRDEALAIWDDLIQCQSFPWRDRALIQLWVQTALNQGGPARASRYLALLPNPLTQSMFEQIDPLLFDDLEDVYRTLGTVVALPRVETPLLRDALKAHQILQVPKVQLTARFAMALHHARLDLEALNLYRSVLRYPAICAKNVSHLRSGMNCLDQWFRIQPSEKNEETATWHALWLKTVPDHPTVQAICRMELARRAARAGNLPESFAELRHASHNPKTENNIRVGALLMEGMLHRLSGNEDQAQNIWLAALKSVGDTPAGSPRCLIDCLVLHCLTQSWDLQSATQRLSNVAGRHLKDDARIAAEAAFNQTFLTDPAWISTFNAILQSEEGRKFAEDYVLCRQPPRELVLRFYRLLFEHYFIVAPPAATRVRQIVDQLVTEMAMNPRGEIAHLYAYLRAWNDPAAAKTLFEISYPYSPNLIESLKWLLQQWHSS